MTRSSRPEMVSVRTLCLVTSLMLVGTTARAQRLAPPSATVGRDVATFVFPLDSDALYQPVAGGLQYGWRIRSGARSFLCGIETPDGAGSGWRDPGPASDLAADSDCWVGDRVRIPSARTYIQPGAMVVELRGRAAIARYFRLRPRTVSLGQFVYADDARWHEVRVSVVYTQ